MIRPATLPLAGGRWEPFVYTIEVEDTDLTGATLLMQIRLTGDTPGTSLVNLTGAIASAQGLSFVVTAGPTSTIQIRINETTMEAMPFPGEIGDDAEFYYDLQITRPGVHDKARYFKGPFTVEAGATQ